MESAALKSPYARISNQYKSEKIRVACYARVSTEHELQLSAFDNQIDWFQPIISAHPNWELIKIYSDRGITGTTMKRPGFQEAIKDGKQGKYELLVTREVCRFARNTVDSLKTVRELASCNTEVYFVSDNIYSFSDDGELRLTLMSALAQEESRKISERVLSGQATSREHGVLFGTGNILGYKLVKRKDMPNTYKIIEEQANTVRQIYRWYLSGIGMRKIVTLLYQNKHKNSKGEIVWQISTVSRILKNKTYAGFKCYKKSVTKDFLSHERVNISNENRYEYQQGDWEPIISEEDFERVQEIRSKKRIIRDNDKIQGIAPSDEQYLHKLRCGCGATMKKYHWRTNKRGDKAFGYSCNNRVRYGSKDFKERNGIPVDSRSCNMPSLAKWKLDIQMESITQYFWKNPERTKKMLLDILKKNIVIPVEENDNTTQIEFLKKQKEKLQKRLINAKNMRLDNEISKEEFLGIKAELEQSLTEIETQLNDLSYNENTNSEEERLKKRQQTIEGIEKALQEIDLAETHTSKAFVDTFIDKISCSEDFSFKWYVNLTDVEAESDADYTSLCKFTIGFEAARNYRKAHGSYLRKNQWKDLKVEVLLKL